MSDPLGDLSAAGVAVWLDDLSRERLETGNLQELIDKRHVVGVTTNPTIFQKALEKGSSYDEQVRKLALRRLRVEEAVREITTYDVRWACDVLRPVYDRTHGVDGRVSIEVDPRLAHDRDRTEAEAEALWWLVDRPNLYIKIPATLDGLPAITKTLAAGISVNVTLIFSLQRYEQVMEAFFAGMEQARDNGHDLSKMGSVASCPVWTPRSTPGSTRSARTGRRSCAGRPRSRTPASRTSGTRSCSRVTAGRRSPTPEPGRSAHCGRPPA
jgi:transaldolase